MSDSLRPHGLQHTRLPCPSSTPRAYEHSCPSSQWCHQPSRSLSSPSSPTFIFFSASVSFPMSQVFTTGGQSIGASASASVLPVIFRTDFLFFFFFQETRLFSKSLLVGLEGQTAQRSPWSTWQLIRMEGKNHASFRVIKSVGEGDKIDWFQSVFLKIALC